MTPLRQLAAMLFLPALMASSVVHAQQTPPPSNTPQPQPTPIGPGPQFQPSVITRPEWIRQPTSKNLQQEYPRRALEQEIAGHAQIRCIVNAAGNMTECKVVSEAPEGYGFGKAALKLSQYFVMRPQTIDATPVYGAVVNIGIPFRPE